MLPLSAIKAAAEPARKLSEAGLTMAASISDGITGTDTASMLHKQAKDAINALPLMGGQKGNER